MDQQMSRIKAKVEITIKKLQERLGCNPLIQIISMNYLDQFLSITQLRFPVIQETEDLNLELLGFSLFSLAWKNSPDESLLTELSRKGVKWRCRFEPKNIFEMETVILQVLPNLRCVDVGYGDGIAVKDFGKGRGEKRDLSDFEVSKNSSSIKLKDSSTFCSQASTINDSLLPIKKRCLRPSYSVGASSSSSLHNFLESHPKRHRSLRVEVSQEAQKINECLLEMDGKELHGEFDKGKTRPSYSVRASSSTSLNNFLESHPKRHRSLRVEVSQEEQKINDCLLAMDGKEVHGKFDKGKTRQSYSVGASSSSSLHKFIESHPKRHRSLRVEVSQEEQKINECLLAMDGKELHGKFDKGKTRLQVEPSEESSEESSSSGEENLPEDEEDDSSEESSGEEYSPY